MGLSKTWIKRRRGDLIFSRSSAEKAAYATLKRLGLSVVRQYPIKTPRKIYYADLYLPQLNTILEIDGGYHTTTSQKRKDSNRSNALWKLGYHVLRLSNKDAYSKDKIVKKIDLIKSK